MKDKGKSNIKMLTIIAMTIMAVVSISNLFGLKIAGLSAAIGIVFYFINNLLEKQPTKVSGLDIKAIANNFKINGIWI